MAGNTTSEGLNERAQHLLRFLVQRYIRDGQPVGSRVLSKETGLDVSPATIRNVMSDLEELGFIASPHTSAGRVPTTAGYRFFVDTLIKLTPPKDRELDQARGLLQAAGDDPKALAESASELLSSFTHLAGVVTLPRAGYRALRQIEFLPLSDRRLLAIMVFNDKEVHNKIVAVDRDFKEPELRRAANYLNEQFAGKDLNAVRRHLVDELQQTQESLNQMMVDAIALAQSAFADDGPTSEFVLAGETNLMGLDELSDIETLRGLFEAFNNKRDILHLLDQSMGGEGVKIFIGRESGYQLLDECSVVTAPYGDDDEAVGVLAVIGPTRMAYERVIPIVDITAKLISSALNSTS